MMEPNLSNGIKEVALGYGLEYKISDRRMREYLAPTYLILRHNHPELRFTAFISEVVKVRAEERKKRGPASEPKEYGIIASLGDISGGRVLNRSVGSTNNRVLWVDDRPDNNIVERRAGEEIGLTFTLALSTAEALEQLSRQRFAAIISDMGRKEGSREGYVLLDALRRGGDQTPFFIYASSNAPEHQRETFEHCGQGCFNNAKELLTAVKWASALGPSDCNHKWHGVKAYLDEVSGGLTAVESKPEQHYHAEQEFLPLCAWCKKIRHGDDSWMTLDDYVSKITGKRFSHGLCPGCAAKFLPTK